LNAPVLGVGLEFIYGSFAKLTSCRPQGFGVGPIPWTAVSQFCRDYHIEDEDREDFEELIAKMDEAYLKYYRDKAEVERKKTPPAPKGRARRH
jgi:hypothetical protein